MQAAETQPLELPLVQMSDEGTWCEDSSRIALLQSPQVRDLGCQALGLQGAELVLVQLLHLQRHVGVGSSLGSGFPGNLRHFHFDVLASHIHAVHSQSCIGFLHKASS